MFAYRCEQEISMPAREYHAVEGSEKLPVPGARKIGIPDPRRVIEVTVLLRPAQAPKRTLTAKDAEEFAAKPPKERTYLSRRELLVAHGADPEDMRKVVRFARAHDLRPVGRDLGARILHLRGTIGAFRRAFRVPLFLYRHAGGVYRGRTGAIYVPEHLYGIVTGVFGLDNRPQARPHFRQRQGVHAAWANAAGISYTPDQVAQIYNFPLAATGKGQCIGIIELGGGFRRSDLQAYFQRLGIAMPTVVAVPVSGGSNAPTGNPNGPDGEVMLDIEVAGAVAPGAKIAVYFAPNTDRGFITAIKRAVHDSVNQPSVISISWGGPESSWTQQSLNAMNNALQAAAAIGVTVCIAAGDGGSSDGVPGAAANVDFPASSPYALACGGTRLEGKGSVINNETVWNDGTGGGAGGGGVSAFFPPPGWQAGAGVPPSVNPPGNTGRGVPDVVGDADPQSGYQIRVDGQDTVIGGTSAVAPLYAGLIALLNEKLGVSAGYLNPFLYQSVGANHAVFHDITKGDNDMTGRVGGYAAGPGWDAASGWGSINGQGLLQALGG
jgi:kumamolisin